MMFVNAREVNEAALMGTPNYAPRLLTALQYRGTMLTAATN